MESDKARGKDEAMRWLGRRLQTEAVLTALHSRSENGVIELRPPRRRPSKDADPALLRRSG
jgi:hypothetical protein